MLLRPILHDLYVVWMFQFSNPKSKHHIARNRRKFYTNAMRKNNKSAYV
jgi:hypothetical protein